MKHWSLRILAYLLLSPVLIPLFVLAPLAYLFGAATKQVMEGYWPSPREFFR